MSMNDEQNVECPLCMEPLELDDINFFPCTCGYQICRFCWHRIRTDENGLCPACRKQYPEDPADFKPLTQEEIQRIKNEKRQKDMQRKQKISENRKHLGNVRVVQKNLVFVVGLSQRLADHEVLKRHEYFGKFGKIHKVVINHSTSYAGSQGPSASAYVTYFRVEDALRAIQAVNNIHVDGRTLKVSLGTTKYCSHFLKSQQCPKPECMYLHELGDDAASFTKEEMQQGKHQEYEKRLHEQLFSNGRRQTASPTATQQSGNGPKETWPSLQAPGISNHVAPTTVKTTEGKQNAKGHTKGEKQQRNKTSEDQRAKRSKDKQRTQSSAEQSSRNQNRHDGGRSDSASSPSPAGSGSAGCETLALTRDDSSSSPCHDSSNSNEAEPPELFAPSSSSSSDLVRFGDDCEPPSGLFGEPLSAPPEGSSGATEENVVAEDEVVVVVVDDEDDGRYAAEVARASFPSAFAESAPVDASEEGGRIDCGGDGETDGPTLNGRTYGSMPNEGDYMGSESGGTFPSAARSVPNSFTSPLDWLGNCHGDHLEAEPTSRGGNDWHSTVGLRAAPIKDDDLGFDPWDESSKALADLIEKEQNACFGHTTRADRVRSPISSSTPQMQIQMQMANCGMQQQHANRNMVSNHMDPHRYLVPHRGGGGVGRLGAPPGFAPNHVHGFNANVPGVGSLGQRPHVTNDVATYAQYIAVLQQPVSNGPNHMYCDSYTNHLSVSNHAKDIRANSRKGHDAYSIKEWEDGLRALLPNVNISFGNPGYRSQAIPPSHIAMQKDKSLGLSNLGWSPPRGKASWMAQDPAIVSSGSIADTNLLLDSLRPAQPAAPGLHGVPDAAANPPIWMKSYRHMDEVVDSAPVMYNNHRFPFGSQLPQTTAPTWPTPLLSQTPPPGFSNSLRTETKPANSLQLTENLI